MSGDPSRFIVLVPMTEVRGLSDVTSALRSRARFLETRLAQGQASPEDAAALDAVKRLLGDAEQAPVSDAGGSAKTAHEPPMMLRVGDVARLAGLSITTVRELIARGELPSVRIGTAVRVRREDLTAWIAGLSGDGWGGAA